MPYGKWIDWKRTDNSACPLNNGTKFQILLAYQKEDDIAVTHLRRVSHSAPHFRWNYTGTQGDIKKYRIWHDTHLMFED